MEAIEEFTARVAERIELLGSEEKRRIFRLLEVRGIVHNDEGGRWIELEGLFPEVELKATSSLCLGPYPKPLPFSLSIPVESVLK